MRLPKSLIDLQRRFYSAQYGQEEADKLLALRGKERAKRLAMLDEHGEKADFLIQKRERENVLNAALDAQAARLKLETEIANIGYAITLASAEVAMAENDAIRERWQADVDHNLNKREEFTKALALAIQVECNAEAQCAQLGRPSEELQPPQIESQPPRTLPLHEEHIKGVASEYLKRIRKQTAPLYKRVFGARRYKEILSLEPLRRLQETWDLDLSKIRDIETFMRLARKPAVKMITTKNALSSMVDYLMAIVLDIPADTPDPQLQEKSELGQVILNDLEPIMEEALATVGEAKEVIRILETRTNEASEKSERSA